MEDFKSEARRKISENIKHRTHRKEIYTEGDEYNEENVGSGQFEYRITPEREASAKRNSSEIDKLSNQRGIGGDEGEDTVKRESVQKERNKEASKKSEAPEASFEGNNIKRDSQIDNEAREKEGSLEEEDYAIAQRERSKNFYKKKEEQSDQMTQEEEDLLTAAGDKAKDIYNKETNPDKETEKNIQEQGAIETKQQQLKRKEAELKRKDKPYNEGVIDMKENVDYWKSSQEGARETFENRGDQLRREVDAAFEEVAQAQERLIEKRQNLGKFNRLRNYLGIPSQESRNLGREYNQAEEEYSQARERYKDKYQQYTRHLYNKRREELEKERGEALERRDSIRLVFSERLVKGDENENGERGESQSIFDYFNNKNLELNRRRLNQLNESRNAIWRRIVETYQRQPRSRRIAGSIVLAGAAGAGAGLFAGASASAAMGYGLYRGGKSLAKGVAGSALSGLVERGVNSRQSRQRGKEEEGLRENLSQRFNEGRNQENEERSNLFDLVDQFNENERRRLRNRRLATGIAAGALAGSFYGLSDFGGFAGDGPGGGSLPDQDKNDSRMAVNATEENGGKKEDVVLEKDKDPQKEYSDNSAELLDKFNQNMKERVENFSEVDEGEIYDAGKELESESDIETEEVEEEKDPTSREDSGVEGSAEILEGYTLNKGDTVWGKLEEYYDGDQNKTGNEILSFKNNLKEDLVEQGFFENAEQADEYMTWRFRHMEVGMEVNMTKEGLDIPGFADEEHINRFKEEELGMREEDLSAVEPEDNSDNTTPVEQESSSSEAVTEEESEPLNEQAEVVESSQELVKGLEDVGIETDSEAWGIAQELTVEDLLENFPPNAGISQIQSNMPPGASLEEAEQLREISRTVDSYTPSSADQTLMVDRFLEDNAG